MALCAPGRRRVARASGRAVPRTKGYVCGSRPIPPSSLRSGLAPLLHVTFAPAVSFDVPVAFADAGFGQPEVKFLDIGIILELFHRSLLDDAAVLHDVAVVGHAQRDPGVLLHEKNGGAL